MIVEEERFMLSDEFLKDKIQVIIPESDEEEPSISIVVEVLQRLPLYGHRPWAPFSMWKPRGRVRLIDLLNDYYLIKFDLEEDYFATLTWRVLGWFLGTM
ncbi:hypothetical protein V2J09_013195 [Rumex salicifolius]